MWAFFAEGVDDQPIITVVKKFTRASDEKIGGQEDFNDEDVLLALQCSPISKSAFD